MLKRLIPIVMLALFASTLRADDQPQAVNLLALGDPAGNTPEDAQITKELNDYCRHTPRTFNGIVMLGDIFNMTLSGPDDPLINKLFEQGYDASAMPFRFYIAMGNHDYEQGKAPYELAYGRLHPQSRWTLPTNYYRVELPPEKPLVTMLVLDSNRQALSDAQWDAELKWLDAELAKPHAPWLICAAHHTIFSNGAHGDNGVLQTQWGELFKKYHVDFYLCGHDHTMQHLEILDWPLSFVISGGGGGGRRQMLRDNRGPFSRSTLGFADLHFDPDAAVVRLLDEKGEPLHVFSRERVSGKTTTLSNSDSDKATTQPLRTIRDCPTSRRHPRHRPESELIRPAHAA